MIEKVVKTDVDLKKHKSQTISGIKWNMLNQLVNLALLFAVGIMLMRILTPTEFGLMGMVNVFSGFLFVMANVGISSSLIQSKQIDEVDKSTVFWTTVIINSLLTLMLILVSPLIAGFYNEPKLIYITCALSSVFIIQALGSIHGILLRKQLAFKTIFINNTLAGILASIISIASALNGAGVWALVVQQVCMALFTSIFYWFNSSFRPSFIFSYTKLKTHLKFGLPLLGSNSFHYWIGSGDNLLIGKFLGVDALGIYARAYSIVTLPTRRFNIVFTTVLFPSFSQIKDDRQRVRTIYLKVMRVIAFFVLPGMGLLIVMAEPFVLLLAGETWLEMVTILQLLSVVAAIKSLGFLTSNVLLSQGRSNIDFKLNTFSGLITLIGFFLAVQAGMLTVGVVYVVTSILVIIPSWYLAGKEIACTIQHTLLNILPLLVIAIVLTGLGYITLQYFNELSTYFKVAIASIEYTFGWITLNYLFNKKVFSEIVTLVKDSTRRS
ncbi:colanic acid exporter [Chryseotalea sanaruensis]|uniref:Colanic acid exporter n=1 Tax=Chryseotalea sanaruensis TaxID=2482724 RepID=A0A401U6V6_9BACT|nr:lipopolysaccharide biosynthesis protein [Chryseotalea sanaruensis]GCC50617.1 colanic acid exporter [Chryseotalea sanaruensis]